MIKIDELQYSKTYCGSQILRFLREHPDEVIENDVRLLNTQLRHNKGNHVNGSKKVVYSHGQRCIADRKSGEVILRDTPMIPHSGELIYRRESELLPRSAIATDFKHRQNTTPLGTYDKECIEAMQRADERDAFIAALNLNLNQ